MAASFWHEFAAGSLGGAAGVFVGHPADTVKVLQQTLGISATAAVRDTFRHEGARGLLKGMSFPLAANGALNALYFGVYSNSLRVLDWALGARDDAGRPAYGRVFVAGCVGGLAQLVVAVPVDLVKIQLQTSAGGVAGVGAWTSILPLDVLKSKLQADDPARPQYRGMLHCAQMTVLRDGPGALLAGFGVMAGRAFLVNAVTFLGYEYSLAVVRRLEGRADDAGADADFAVEKR
ncbi:solute carrier family 25 member 45-like [Pollicipes pollicipes]|uniref:solute carrier family 25 member 45-like n=1 Tax=Pollicipes pollicipes TaxID=41117 RepID=UPI0018857BE8|nr:solute carrier family 25 member 45-like [Pollicipes pollicipes]